MRNQHSTPWTAARILAIVFLVLAFGWGMVGAFLAAHYGKYGTANNARGPILVTVALELLGYLAALVSTVTATIQRPRRISSWVLVGCTVLAAPLIDFGSHWAGEALANLG